MSVLGRILLPMRTAVFPLLSRLLGYHLRLATPQIFGRTKPGEVVGHNFLRPMSIGSFPPQRSN